MIKFIDVCSGIGGGRLGLSKVGFKCLGFSEINKNAIKTYKDFFGDNENNFGDCTTLNISTLPKFDLLIAGFPCQTFSIVGNRKGFSDDRGKIIFSLANILKEKNVKYFIFENVKGLINLDNGDVLKNILNILDQAGYNVSYSLLDSYDFGVPQQRERVYFVGIRKDLKSSRFNFDNIKKSKSNYNISDFLFNETNKLESNDKKYESFIRYLNNKYNQGKFSFNDLVKKDFLIIDYRQSDLRIYNNKIPTLRAGRHGILYSKDGDLHFLTGRDALLLQGFTKRLINKIDFASNTSLLTLAGNAMTVNVIEAIAKELKRIIL